ncbi:MAG TPA: ABC transporter permease [Terriglobales bacterium]|nr:ABC transporter permease [Terriglobales bacterium]
MLRELRYSLRLLWKHPGLSLVAILSLTLGIGANTTIFSFANALLFRQPPVAQPQRLVEVWIHDPEPGAPLGGLYPLSYPDYLDFSARTHSLSGLAIYNPGTEVSVSTGAGAQPAAWTGQLVSANYFGVLGIQPALGRWFAPQEGAVKGTGAVLVLSYGAWQQRFGGARDVIGRPITLNQVPYTIIGVAPRGFEGMFAGVACDFWVPVSMADRLGSNGMLERRGQHSLLAVGRLRPGVSVASASAEMGVIQRGIARQHPNSDSPRYGAQALPVGLVPTPFRGFVGAGVGLLAVVVGLVLLIACANAALVLLVQALGQRREWAVRSALGASRGRLVRQGLIHSVLLALIAGALGIGVAQLLGPLLLQLRPPGFPITLALGVDSHVLLFTLAIALATGVLFGLAPAWQGARLRVVDNLKDGSPGAGARSRARSAFIIGQVALCVVVLVGAALCLRSLAHARSINPGFDVQHTVTAQVDPLTLGYAGDAARQFLQRAQAAVAALPGVQAVSYTSQPPLQLSVSGTYVLPVGMAPPPGHRGFEADDTGVAPGYFAASGTPLLQGRDFTRADLAPGQPHLVVINQVLAQQFWPHGDALGHSLLFPGDKDFPSAQIVGVAATGKYRSLGEAPRPYLYQLSALRGGMMLVRVRGNASTFLPSLRRTLQQLDPNLTADDVQTMAQTMSVPLFPARFTGILLSGFGLLALLLAIVGLYGVIAAAVAQRTREYGIRMALGADAPALLRLVVGQGLRLALWGILAGVLVAAGLTHFMAALLYGLSPADPVSYLAAALALALVAALASYIPALRATRVDPLRALRWE